MISSESPTSPSPRERPQQKPWLDHWFPVAFERDLTSETLERVTVHGHSFVVFRAAEGALSCLPDRCPHRGARLSDGRIVNGRVECLYHGWQFDGDGRCLHIPQLESDGHVPQGASCAAVSLRVIDGLVWIFPGDSSTQAGAEALANPPEVVAGVEREGVHRIDFAMDLPYGHAAMIENVLDFAHIHIAHDGVRGGGSRDQAGPLHFEIQDRGARGFEARFLSTTKDDSDPEVRTTGASVAFVAPGLVHFTSTFPDMNRVAGLALHALPIDEVRCRLFYRAYGHHFPESDRRRPRWREHLHQLRLLEQDMALVIGQIAELRRSARPLREQWLPIKSSDALVVRYARWIDEHAAGLPGALGWNGVNVAADAPRARPATDRWTLHTSRCVDCQRAKMNLDRSAALVERAGWFCLLLAALLPVPWSIPAAALALGAWRVGVSRRALGAELTRDALAHPGTPHDDPADTHARA